MEVTVMLQTWVQFMDDSSATKHQWCGLNTGQKCEILGPGEVTPAKTDQHHILDWEHLHIEVGKSMVDDITCVYDK